MPVLTGPKSDGQKFPGAVYTLCIEAMMQDSKALQAGTSHFLGQNFAKAFDVKFQNAGRQAGIRLGDELGRLHAAGRRPDHDAQRRPGPGAAAAAGADSRRHRADLPQGRGEARPCSRRPNKLAAALRDLPLRRLAQLRAARVKVDDREQYQPGYKFNEWELKGVPVRVELGPKDLAQERLRAGPARPARQGSQGDGRAAGRGAGPHRRACSRRCRPTCSSGPAQFRDANSSR